MASNSKPLSREESIAVGARFFELINRASDAESRLLELIEARRREAAESERLANIYRDAVAVCERAIDRARDAEAQARRLLAELHRDVLGVGGETAQ